MNAGARTLHSSKDAAVKAKDNAEKSASKPDNTEAA